LIIASDVIEHLKNPDKLLKYIANCANNNTYIIISTPLRTRDDINNEGRPKNHAHVREWNQEEFCQYLESRGLELIEHELVNKKQGRDTKNCQVAVCKLSE
jgi:hypothetical protein